jgi:Tfp pilus assembly protein PilN
MRAVNLLPRDEAARRRSLPNKQTLLAATLPVAVAALVGGGLMLEQGSVTSKRDQLAMLESQLAALPVPEPVDPTNAMLAQEKGKRITVLSGVLSSRVAFDRILRELSLVLPDDVWLTGLTARSSEALGASASGAASTSFASPTQTDTAAAPTAENADFVLNGYTYSQEGVARLLARLAVVPHLRDVQLERSALVPVSNRSVVQFTILAELRTGKDAS